MPKNSARPTSPASTGQPGTPAAFTPAFVLGLVGLLVALAGAGMLVLHHFGTIELAGCGVGDACDKATKGPMGRIAGVPVSFIGLAGFAGLLAAWFACKGRAPLWLSWVSRLSIATSFIYVGAMLALDAMCPYCLTTHVGNLIFLGAVMWSRAIGARAHGPTPMGPPAAKGSFIPAATMAGVSLVSAGLLIGFGSSAQSAADANAEARRQADVAQIAARATPANTPNTNQHQDLPTSPNTAPTPTPNTNIAPTTPTTPTATTPNSATPTSATPNSATSTNTAQASTPPTPAAPDPITGRFRFGPDKAKVRLVMFTSYQCPDCFKIDQEMMDLMKSVPDLAVSIRYFPLSNKCNPQVPNDPQPNACWAARAAEAAGRLYGVEGFWKMHQWLFARRGSFTDAELDAGLAQLGFDRVRFLATMTGLETQQAVTQDIELGVHYGIRQTPMIFINGVELKGWMAPQALTRTINEVLAANPVAAGPENDLPPTGAEKFLEDWRLAPKTNIPDSLLTRSTGPEDAPVRVLVIGDYQEPGTNEVDAICRLFAKVPPSGRTGETLVIRYSFVAFPVDQSCNPSSQRTVYPQGCLAARAVEAAEVIAGADGAWAMHGWLMSHQANLTQDAIMAACPEVGLDPTQLADAMSQDFVNQAIAQRARQAMALGLRSVPRIYVNGRAVTEWKVEAENLLPRIFNAAMQGK